MTLPQENISSVPRSSRIEIPALTNQQVFPFVVALLVILLLEILVALPPVQTQLNRIAVNPLPKKFIQLDAMAHQPGGVEVLALGTSRTLNGFIPSEFSKNLNTHWRAYNMGLPRAGYDWMFAYLKDHVARYGKPKLLILETSDLIFDKQYSTEGLYYQNLALRDPSVIPYVLQYPDMTQSAKSGIITAMISGLRRYRNVLSPFSLARFIRVGNDEATKNPDLTSEGWQPLLISNMTDAPDHLWVKEDNFLPVDTQEITMLLDYCQQIHLPVVFVKWPDQGDYRKLTSTSPLSKALDESLNSLANKYHVQMVDLNEVQDSEKAVHFTDARHLNPHGAKDFSAILAKKVSAI